MPTMSPLVRFMNAKCNRGPGIGCSAIKGSFWVDTNRETNMEGHTEVVLACPQVFVATGGPEEWQLDGIVWKSSDS